MKDGQDTMQKLTDKNVKEIDEVVGAKEKEVMKV
jgi:ribosome recycling factor